jgi:hypothetical protein
MVNKRGGIGFVIVILLLVLAVVVIGVVVYVGGNKEPVKPTELNTTMNVSMFNITVSANALLKVDYSLRNSTNYLLNGLLFPNAIEFYGGGVPNQSLVWLSAWSDDYYWNESVCNVTRNDFPCRVGLKRKSLNYTIVFNGSDIVVDTNGTGVLQSPILCVIEHANVLNAIISLNSSPVPVDLVKHVDYCYSVGEDIRNVSVFHVDVHKNPFFNVSLPLAFTLRDFERSGFHNVGDKSSEAVV